MLSLFPFTLLPLILFNLVAYGAGLGPDPFAGVVMTIDMISGARFSLTVGDLFIIGGIVLLFVEILKATRTGAATLTDHVLSMLVFVAYLVEFLIAAPAAHSVFLILTVIAFIDVVAGFTITIRAARRDIGWS